MWNGFSNYLARRLPFGYGYVMAGVALVLQVCSSPGQTFAISAFAPSLRESLQLSDTTLTSAYMLGTVCAAFPLSWIGAVTDRFGLRITTGVIAFALGTVCCCAAFVNGLVTLFLVFLLLRFLAQGSLSLISSNAVGMWFDRKLGRVSATMSIGMATAFAFVPALLSESIDAHGWRATYILMGVAVWLILLPLTVLVFRNRPEELGQTPDHAPLPEFLGEAASDVRPTAEDATLADALGSAGFWILTAAMASWAMIGTGLVFYLVDFGAQQGVDKENVLAVFTTFAYSMLAAQLLAGVLADYVDARWLQFVSVGLLAIGTYFYLNTTSAGTLHLFAGTFGLGQGAMITVSATVWVRYYGRLHLGKIRGAAWSAAVAGSGLGPFLLGFSSDYYGSFEPALWAFVLVLAAIALLTPLARRPKTRSYHNPVAQGMGG